MEDGRRSTVDVGWLRALNEAVVFVRKSQLDGGDSRQKGRGRGVGDLGSVSEGQRPPKGGKGGKVLLLWMPGESEGAGLGCGMESGKGGRGRGGRWVWFRLDRLQRRRETGMWSRPGGGWTRKPLGEREKSNSGRLRGARDPSQSGRTTAEGGGVWYLGTWSTAVSQLCLVVPWPLVGTAVRQTAA